MLDTRLLREIQFANYRILKDARLPLGPVTLIVGPNGSGKSTALGSFSDVRQNTTGFYQRLISIPARATHKNIIVDFVWGPSIGNSHATRFVLQPNKNNFDGTVTNGYPVGSEASGLFGHTTAISSEEVSAALQTFAVFSLVPSAIAADVQLLPNHRFEVNGHGLAGVLDRVRDHSPEAFERFNRELPRWFPEFNRLLFDTPSQGARSVVLRTKDGAEVPARELSEGTLLSLALMTLAYAPGMPRLFALEEPDRGLHPRMLGLVRDVLFRLAQPADYSDDRPASQVIVTTHSPYLLDLFRDFPECVVVANRNGDTAMFERLIDRPDYEKLLGEAPLGEAWYSGLLGGVPDRP